MRSVIYQRLAHLILRISQEGREGGLISGQRLKFVWEGKAGTKDTQRDMGMGQESGHPKYYKGYTTQMNRDKGSVNGEYEIQVEGRNRGTEVENWHQFQRTEIRGVRSELKGLISGSAKTLVIMNKEFKNTPDRVSRSPTPRRGVIQAGNNYEKDASPKLTNGPSVVTEVKDGGSFQITKTEGSTQRSSSLKQNESSGNGEGSHSEMGRKIVRHIGPKLTGTVS